MPSKSMSTLASMLIRLFDIIFGADVDKLLDLAPFS